MREALALILVFIVAILAIGILPFFTDSSRISVGEQEVSYFTEALEETVLENVGQPIEGINAHTLKVALPGLRNEDFSGVVTREGMYRVSGGELVFERTIKNPITSAEEMIVEKGYKILFSNLLNRFSIAPADSFATERLLILLEEENIHQRLSMGYLHNDFIIRHNGEWKPATTNPAIVFTLTNDGSISNIENLSALASYILITTHKEEISPFAVIEERKVRINDVPLTRMITRVENEREETLRYYYENGEKMVSLVHYPYLPESVPTKDFEKMMQTFRPVQ